MSASKVPLGFGKFNSAGKEVCTNLVCKSKECRVARFHSLEWQQQLVVVALSQEFTDPSCAEQPSANRRRNCNNGYLCINANCGYKHVLKPECRKVIHARFMQHMAKASKDATAVLATTSARSPPAPIETVSPAKVDVVDRGAPTPPPSDLPLKSSRQKVLDFMSSPVINCWADVGEDETLDF